MGQGFFSFGIRHGDGDDRVLCIHQRRLIAPDDGLAVAVRARAHAGIGAHHSVPLHEHAAGRRQAERRIHRRAGCIRQAQGEHQPGQGAVPRGIAAHGIHAERAAILKQAGKLKERLLLAHIAEQTGHIVGQNRAVAAVLKEIAHLHIAPRFSLLLGKETALNDQVLQLVKERAVAVFQRHQIIDAQKRIAFRRKGAYGRQEKDQTKRAKPYRAFHACSSFAQTAKPVTW